MATGKNLFKEAHFHDEDAARAGLKPPAGRMARYARIAAP